MFGKRHKSKQNKKLLQSINLIINRLNNLNKKAEKNKNVFIKLNSNIDKTILNFAENVFDIVDDNDRPMSQEILNETPIDKKEILLRNLLQELEKMVNEN